MHAWYITSKHNIYIYIHLKSSASAYWYEYIHLKILRISLLSAADLLFGCPFGMLSNLYRASENNVRNNNENIKKLIKKKNNELDA